MACFDERLIDPDPELLAKTLRRATSAANGRLKSRRLDKDVAFWQRFVHRTRKRLEGQQTWKGTRSFWGAMVRAAWWSDPVGRKHWRIVGRRSDHTDYYLRNFAFAEYPLWHIYPDRLALRQEERKLLACCDCGVQGPIDRIAWMGERCGPCHDRAEEGVCVELSPPPTMRGPGTGVSQLAFLGQDRLVSAGYNGRVILWNLDDNSGEVLLHRRGGRVSPLATTSGGAIALSTAGNRVLLRDPEGGDWRTLELRCGQVSGLAFSPDERWLGVSGSTCFLLVDLFSSDFATRHMLPGHYLSTFRFAPDSRTLWALDSAADLYRIEVPSGRADLVRSRPESEPDTFADYFEEMFYSPSPSVMACSPDGRWVAVVASWGDWWGTHVGDLRTGRWFTLRASSGVVAQSLAFLPDNSLVSRDSDGAIRLWDVARQQVRSTLLPDPTFPGARLSAFSAQAEMAALSGQDGTIRLVPWRAMLEA
jgi:hypothetical protein